MFVPAERHDRQPWLVLGICLYIRQMRYEFDTVCKVIVRLYVRPAERHDLQPWLVSGICLSIRQMRYKFDTVCKVIVRLYVCSRRETRSAAMACLRNLSVHKANEVRV